MSSALSLRMKPALSFPLPPLLSLSLSLFRKEKKEMEIRAASSVPENKRNKA